MLLWRLVFEGCPGGDRFPLTRCSNGSRGQCPSRRRPRNSISPNLCPRSSSSSFRGGAQSFRVLKLHSPQTFNPGGGSMFGCALFERKGDRSVRPMSTLSPHESTSCRPRYLVSRPRGTTPCQYTYRRQAVKRIKVSSLLLISTDRRSAKLQMKHTNCPRGSDPLPRRRGGARDPAT